MSTPYAIPDPLPADVTALLRAVHDALDLPLPDITVKDDREYRALLTGRVIDVRTALVCVLEHGHDMAGAAESLRRWIAAAPVTYTPYTPRGDREVGRS